MDIDASCIFYRKPPLWIFVSCGTYLQNIHSGAVLWKPISFTALSDDVMYMYFRCHSGQEQCRHLRSSSEKCICCIPRSRKRVLIRCWRWMKNGPKARKKGYANMLLFYPKMMYLIKIFNQKQIFKFGKSYFSQTSFFWCLIS